MSQKKYKEQRKLQESSGSPGSGRSPWMVRSILIITALILVGIIIILNKGGNDKTQNVDFAKCLTEKKAVMYGADTCPACLTQKELFGKEAFKSINYVNCAVEREKCKQNDILQFPTWIIDGNKLEPRVRTLEELGKETGCVLNESVK